MSDFITAARSLLVPQVLALVIPCAVVILAVLLAEAHERMERRIAETRGNPYHSIDTDEARAHHRQLADETRARREAAERRARGGAA